MLETTCRRSGGSRESALPRRLPKACRGDDVRRNRPRTLALYTAVINAAGAAALLVIVALDGLPPLTSETAVLLLALVLSDVLVLHPFAGKNEVTSNALAFASRSS